MMFNAWITAMLLSAATATSPAQPTDKSIVRLVGQHTTITICSTAAGPRYSASDSSGRVIGTDLTLSDLRKNHPELSRQIDFGFCASAD